MPHFGSGDRVLTVIAAAVTLVAAGAVGTRLRSSSDLPAELLGRDPVVVPEWRSFSRAQAAGGGRWIGGSSPPPSPSVVSPRKAGVQDGERFLGCIRGKEVAREIRRDSLLAVNLGIRGTPAILVDSLLFPGFPGADALERLIKHLR